MAFSFIDRLLGKGEKSAKAVAKDRLQLVLMHDRADIPAPVLDKIRKGFLIVLAENLDIDEQTLEVSMESKDTTVALIASIPIRRVRSGSHEKPN